jgi:exosortase/archaeosortase family protein
VRFLLGWACALSVASFVPGVERWAIHGTLQSLGFVCRFFTRSVFVANPDFVLGGTPVTISPDCTPLMPTAALWVAILAYPAPRRWKLTGLLAGAGLLWLYNLGRILTTVAVLKTRPEWFELVHVYLWQTVTVIAVFGLFVLWLRFEPRRRSAP